jgi:NADP-dependent 3-hydroxy acid dehydrogenase YdfG
MKIYNYVAIIISRNETELKQLSEEIGCEYKVCDVLDFDKVKSISEEYKDRLSGIAFCVGSIN